MHFLYGFRNRYRTFQLHRGHTCWTGFPYWKISTPLPRSWGPNWHVLCQRLLYTPNLQQSSNHSWNWWLGSGTQCGLWHYGTRDLPRRWCRGNFKLTILCPTPQYDISYYDVFEIKDSPYLPISGSCLIFWFHKHTKLHISFFCIKVIPSNLCYPVLTLSQRDCVPFPG